MTFNVVSDLYVGSQKVSENSKGVAINKSMSTIPPLGDDIFVVDKLDRNNDEIKFGQFLIVASECYASIATLSSLQKIMFKVGKTLGIVPKDVFSKTLFLH